MPQPGWISENSFLAGYGAAQAVPEPLFSFAAYLGTMSESGSNACAIGQAEIGDEEIKGFAFRDRDSACNIRSGQNGEHSPLQEAAEDSGCIDVIFHKEKAKPRCGCVFYRRVGHSPRRRR